MRPTLPLLTAALLAIGGVACDSSADVEEALEDVGNTVSEVATDAADAVSEAAEEVGDAAGDAADLVGFCTAAARTRDAVEERESGDALEAAEDMAAEAPEEIAPQTETVLDGIRTWHDDGDEEAFSDQEFQTAADEVRTYAEDRCDPRS